MQRDIENALVFLKQAFRTLDVMPESYISHFESEDEVAEKAPIQYACWKISQAIGCLN